MIQARMHGAILKLPKSLSKELPQTRQHILENYSHKYSYDLPNN